ncbi:MAG: ribonuclease R [Parcubacteria bacterium C7867-001]|nr:MAG: ribonuclease R [Parcubacteria bacterium C7867-001]
MAAKDETIYEGVISVTRSGTGFFARENGKEDFIIQADDLGGAFPYDIVKVQSVGFIEDRRSGGKREAGKVLEIVTRARTEFVGKLIEPKPEDASQFKAILIPDWKKMYVPFEVRGENPPFGYKVLITLGGWDAGARFPWGTVKEVIGIAGDHDVEMRAVALAQGFHSDFPPGVKKEAEELEKNGQAMLDAGAKDPRRKDFRGTTTFTIDPFDAKDFDDALSVKELPDGNFEIGVHIADVSHFVVPGTEIDAEGRNRATSVYLVDRTIPMLPHVLSTNLCSLNPDLDRLAVSAVFTLDKDAGIIETWFGETVIHSDKRFTYENAQEVLDKGEGELFKELTILKTLADKIRARRVKKGAIEFDTAEVKIELDENGKPIAIRLKERKATNLLIEDFMLLANEAVAEHLEKTTKKKGLANGVIYRVHDVPDAERIENLAAFLKVLGYNLPVTGAGQVKGTDLNQLLEQVKGKPEEYLIKSATLRSMSKAIYTTKNNGHFGLAFSHYTHFTSPIRRYPDLLVHRMVKHIEHGDEVTKKELDELERLAVHSSEREVSASEAERDSIKLKQVEFLMDKIGTEFDAVISGVTANGFYVEEQSTRADGMVRINSIGDDYYTFDEKRYRLVGERTKKEYALGDPIRVRLIAARPFERELDFELVK